MNEPFDILGIMVVLEGELLDSRDHFSRTGGPLVILQQVGVQALP